MFAIDDDIASRATSCAVDIGWRQWTSLTAAGLPIGEPRVASIVDPEALVLLSLLVRQHERRLDDRLRWWATAGTALMSVQRMRTLVADFPARARTELAWFAALAVEAGDPRWRVLADGAATTPSGRADKGPRELRLVAPSTLMLRLRAGFGVGAKADLLAFLLGVASARSEHAGWPSASGIAAAISYSVASTRRAATDMSLAGLVEARADRPVRYSVDASAWSRVLLPRGPGVAEHDDVAAIDAALDLPAWCFWSQMFAFLAACTELGDDPTFTAAAPVVQASHLRDLAERFRRPLAWNGIEWPDPRRFPGQLYGEAFARIVTSVVAWIDSRD